MTENDRKMRVAITHGDTNGIGYELIFKTFATPEMLELCTPIVYGSPKAAAYHRKMLGLNSNFSIIHHADEARENNLNVLATFDDEVKIDAGVPTSASGEAARQAIDRALADAQEGLVDALVLAPVDAANVPSMTGYANQIAYAADKLHKSAMNILTNDCLRIGFVTENVPLRQAVNGITLEQVRERATALAECLKRDFRIFNPRIAVLSMNPVVASQDQQLFDDDTTLFGPFAAKDFFANGTFKHFDAVLAMYYEQGVVPFTMIGQENGVLFTAGLDVPCAMAAGYSTFDGAGKGESDEQPMRNAIYLAIDAARNRANYDEPLANPLQKLYNEKPDDGERVRFTIPKKRADRLTPEELAARDAQEMAE